jgi:transcriptional regulator with XRE-family HTH domain
MPSSLRSPRYRVLVRRLIELRKALSLTQADLARRISKPQSFIAKVETGKRRLDVIELIDLVRALDADPLDFVAHLAAQRPPRQR